MDYVIQSISQAIPETVSRSDFQIYSRLLQLHEEKIPWSSQRQRIIKTPVTNLIATGQCGHQAIPLRTDLIQNAVRGQHSGATLQVDSFSLSWHRVYTRLLT